MAQKRIFEIRTPRGTVYQTRTANGKVIAHLEWEPGFGPSVSQGFQRAQEVVDSECLRYMKSLTPKRSGYLINSATLGTVIGSGKIEYLAPYARRQYYENSGKTDPTGNRGKLWFERMKAAHLEDIRKGAANFVANR